MIRYNKETNNGLIHYAGVCFTITALTVAFAFSLYLADNGLYRWSAENYPLLTTFWKYTAFGLSLFVLAISVLLSPIPMRIGLYRRIAKVQPRWTGFLPAFHHGVEWGYTLTDLYKNDLTGQTAIITGGNSGIGYEAALALSRLGASVIIAGRNIHKCNKAAEIIRADKDSRGPVTAMVVDVSSLESVRNFVIEFCKREETLDMLFLNAGIASAGSNSKDGSATLSVDGIEKVFATNLLGHHLMYRLLEPKIQKQSKPTRIVLTSSGSSFRNNPSALHKIMTDLKTLNHYDPNIDGHARYRQTKLGQIMWTKELTRRLAAVGNDSNNNNNSTSHVFVNSYHPGVVDTPIFDKDPNIAPSAKKLISYVRKNVLWSATDASLTMLYLGVAVDDLIKKNVRGKYFHPVAHEVTHPLANNEKQQMRLWAFLDELTKTYVD